MGVLRIRRVRNLTRKRVGDCCFVPLYYDRLCDLVSGLLFPGFDWPGS